MKGFVVISNCQFITFNPIVDIFMDYQSVSEEHIKQFESICGSANVLVDGKQLEDYSHDHTEDYRFLPEVVVLPTSAEQVSQILFYCNKNRIPITPRGAGTGLSGGALAIHRGICLSAERMNKIIEIDERNLQATLQPGVINEVLQNAVKEKGLFYPPDPASKGSCFIGGNVAENSGGPKAVKYGVTSAYILNLQVVLPTGDIIWTGANTLKNSTGYNLTQLMIGSEGTLGIVTEIVVKLIPFPTKNMLLWVPFPSAEDACRAVSEVFKAGIIPSALEFMERDAVLLSIKHLGRTMELSESVQGILMVEVDGNDEDQLMKDLERISEVLYKHECGEIMLADTSDQKESFWKIRRSIGEAVKASSVYKEEDTVVPRAELPKLLKGVKEIGQRYGFNSICYGHVGDGNLHVNILKGNMSDEDWNSKIKVGIREIFTLCHQLMGTISGEHGIGYVQKEFMDIVFSPVHINLMKSIKSVFDPNNILNPGKIFP